MPYLYDVFFSYKRDVQSDPWHEEVMRKLQHWLKMELQQSDVRIFFDKEDIHTGVRWQQKIANSLRGSKCIVCVWSPLYFQSKWCVSEWKTFAAREKLCNRELIIPASYHDGDTFPKEARDKQFMRFSDYTSTMPKFWETESAAKFEEKCLKPFARDLAQLIKAAPSFDELFPLIEADDQQVMVEATIERPATV